MQDFMLKKHLLTVLVAVSSLAAPAQAYDGGDDYQILEQEPVYDEEYYIPEESTYTESAPVENVEPYEEPKSLEADQAPSSKQEIVFRKVKDKKKKSKSKKSQ